MLKKIGLALGAALLVFLGFVATRPAEMHLERSTTMAARPQLVFDLIDDFHGWDQWSPWDELDPNQKKGHEGAARGKGAITTWEGNKDVGKGRMEILESTAPSRIHVDLHFMEPFEAKNTVTFSISTEAGATKVVWAMDGSNNFMAKMAGVFMDMDAMVGKDFEKGLARMKTAAEKAEATLKAEEEAKAAAEAAAAAVLPTPSDASEPMDGAVPEADAPATP